MSEHVQHTQPAAAQDEEISLKELILKLGEWWRYLWSRWLVILVVGLLGGALGLLIAILKKPKYTAELSFVLEDEKGGGGLAAYAGIASQFGINLGGAGGGGLFEGDNIMEFLKSRSMIEKTLLSAAPFEGEEDLLVDRYVAFNELRESWEEDDRLANLQFRPDSGIFLQDSLMREFYKDITRNLLSVSKPDKKLSIIAVKVTTPDEQFSKVFTEKLIENATQFYTETRTKKSQENLAIISKQVDSVRRELNEAIGGVASAAEGTPNANPAFQRTRVPSQRRTVDVQANTAILTELVKNQEIARLTLRNDKPLIQVLDRPVLPLEEEKLGKAKGIIIGGILGGFLICLYLIGVRLYRQVMEGD